MARRSLLVLGAALAIGLGALVSACSSSDATSSSDVTLSAAGEQGKTVAKEQGCVACHSADGSKNVGPTWQGLAGSKVELADGTTVVADDDYLRQSILQPKAQIVDGFSTGMPIYDGEVSDAELADLLAYLHDLAPAPKATTTTAG